MITRPCYCTREDVKSALDIKLTARADSLVDDSICSAGDAVDGLLNRRFYPEDRTAYFDWPNYQAAYPWRIWLDAAELADVTVNVPVVTSGGVVIPANQVFWGHPNYSPPYRYIELNRSTSAFFGGGMTPQRSVAIAGTFGYWLKLAGAGTLAAPVADTTSVTLSVSASQAGVGDVIVVGSERMLVTGRAFADTAIAFSGPASASSADNVLAVPDGTQFAVGEVVAFDAERCLITGITGNNLVLKRAWDGTILAAHTSGTIWAARSLTVARGQLGTAAATHLSGATVSRSVVPAMVRELSLAESINNVLQKNSGYSRTVGEGQTLQPISGAGLRDVRARACASYGRGARMRVI